VREPDRNMNRNNAGSFLQRLHGALDRNGGTVRFLAKDHATGQVRRFTAKPGDLPAFSGIGAEWHVYATVAAFNGKTRHADNAVAVPAVWADLDPPAELAGDPLDEWRHAAELRLATFTPAPSVIVFSGRGLHAYWIFNTGVLLDKPQVRDLVVGVNRALADALDGDAVGDLARLMRLPGTVNPKTGLACREIWTEGPRYSLPELVDALNVKPHTLKRAVDADLPGANTAIREGSGRRSRGRPRLGATLRDLRGLPPWARALVIGGAWRGRDRYRRPGGGPDRSRADLAVGGAMVRAGWSTEKIAAAFQREDWKIGARYLELHEQEGEGRARDYLTRTIRKAAQS